MIITVTMNPAIDKTAYVETLHVRGLNRLENVNSTPGGKGINVSKTICALGGNSIATGFLAGGSGAYIENCLRDLNIQSDMVYVDGETRVNLKVVDAQKELTELNEVGPSIRAEQCMHLCDKVVSLAKANDIVVLSGSVPQGVSKDVYALLISRLKQKQARVILDADRALFEQGMKAKPNIIKPNKYELCKYFNAREDIDDAQVAILAKRLLLEGVDLVVVSMGKAGALFVDENHSVRVAGLQIDAQSSVGAGDAMVAALAYGVDQSLPFEEMVRLALATSAGACESKGTQPAPLERVRRLMKEVKIEKVEEE